ncbi:uncharacterized protein [Anser cygnoides]|uniref:uncharacterized protein isoform X2 n=1 Tax=Anser cygnoides TaxID=8845 RepID=UPI0034D2ADD1
MRDLQPVAEGLDEISIVQGLILCKSFIDSVQWRKKLQELQHSDGKYKTHYVKEGIAETKRRTKEDKGEEKNEKEVQASIEKRSRPQQDTLLLCLENVESFETAIVFSKKVNSALTK